MVVLLLDHKGNDNPKLPLEPTKCTFQCHIEMATLLLPWHFLTSIQGTTAITPRQTTAKMNSLYLVL